MALKLTHDEQRFVTEFVKDMNPVLACERLGYGEETAREMAYIYLGKEHIKEAMAEAVLVAKRYQSLNDVTARDLGITEGYIMMRLKSIADRSDKATEQLRALELLGKSLGLFKETSKLEINDTTKRSAFSPEDRRKMIETVNGKRQDRLLG